MRKKLMMVTTSRADYGLLYPLIKEINNDGNLDFNLVVTGSHLSQMHGMTIEQIRNDGVNVDYTVEMISCNDTEDDICKAISKGLEGFSKVICEMKPDFLIVLGDRYELWSACMAAVIYKLPIAHIHGGEVTYGVIDEAVRHSVSKMASIHFPTIQEYGDRLIKMGENYQNVHIVGALGLDNIKNIGLMDKDELCKFTGVDFNSDIALMTYHPVTLDDYSMAQGQIIEVLEAIIDTDLTALITMPNSDTAGMKIYEAILNYAKRYPEKVILKKSLGQKGYLSAMKYAKLMIGNSSSGIIESASFKLPVVNIGDRQEGRVRPQNVIDCICDRHKIKKAINMAISSEFNNKIENLQNPYGDGNTAQRIAKVLRNIDLYKKNELIKKKFFD